MTLTQILDASALTVLAAQAGWIALLYRRMGRLRSALEGAGEVIAQLDEASRRLDASAGGIVQKVRDGIAEVDSKITACRRLSQELSAASRNAEEVALRLDRALRQNRKLNAARAAAPPRELVEPLGRPTASPPGRRRPFPRRPSRRSWTCLPSPGLTPGLPGGGLVSPAAGSVVGLPAGPSAIQPAGRTAAGAVAGRRAALRRPFGAGGGRRRAGPAHHPREARLIARTSHHDLLPA
ncbi:hypothetical protein [Teichococcus aestuarii]|uniref:hypothetical protein n=1 Tax=Teichococcus aestuarii TaxID=568898 RepID=UPI0036221079